MRCLDLFAGGCNGFGLAAQWMGWETVACVEIDKFNQKLLRKNFQEAEIYGDIREFNEREAAKYRGRINLITGGDPCQPSSLIGLQRGIKDEKYLWPEMLESIKIIGPSFIVNENVVGTVTNGILDRKIDDLEALGYSWEAYNIPAEAVGSVHERQRIFLIAYSTSRRLERRNGRSEARYGQAEIRSIETLVENKNGVLCPISDLHREYDAVPFSMERIKALGNAVVPQIPYEIYQAIESTFL